jgi:hypothetical protein
VLADEHEPTRELLQTMLSMSPSLEIVGSCADGVTAVDLAVAEHADIREGDEREQGDGRRVGPRPGESPAPTAWIVGLCIHVTPDFQPMVRHCSILVNVLSRMIY